MMENSNIHLFHLVPKTLSLFGDQLQHGFIEYLKEIHSTITISLEIDRNENPEEFMKEIFEKYSSMMDRDHHHLIFLIELHGAEYEKRIFESCLQKNFNGKIFVIIHRPEEYILRIMFENQFTREKAEQYISTLFERVDGLIFLGDSGIPLYSSIVTNQSVMVIPHPYFTDFSSTQEVTALRFMSHHSPVIVLGSITTWGEMRSLSDLSNLLKVFREFLKNTSSDRRILGYAAGKFQTNHIDILTLLRSFPHDYLILSNEDILSAYRRNEFHNEETYRNWLFKISLSGIQLIIRGNINEAHTLFFPESFDPNMAASDLHSWENNLIDFNLQFYREILNHLRQNSRQNLPKLEYSGTLHTGGERINELYLVYESESMLDILQNEGLHLLLIPFFSSIEEYHQSECYSLCPLNEDQIIFPLPDYRIIVEKIIELVNAPDDWLAHLQHNRSVTLQYTR